MKVVLLMKDNPSKELWLYIHYLDEDAAKVFLEKNKPVRASSDDF